jgi:glycosyltransferase involved in cell wall biosynthesis
MIDVDDLRSYATTGLPAFSIVIPCYNEEDSIAQTVQSLSAALADSKRYEIIVVNDGSSDGTQRILAELVETHERLNVITHRGNRGYGAALKTGISRAMGELIAITDADGTYPNEQLLELIERCTNQDMVVGARIGEGVIYSKIRQIPKFFLKHWVSWLARRDVPDINSGMRVFRKDVAKEYFHILPDTFSFTITITLAMLTNYRRTEFVPIRYQKRVGRSKIKPIRDTLRFLQIILRTGVYFAPIRAFMPIFAVLLLASCGSLSYDVIIREDLTEKTLLLFLFTLNIGMFTLIADMIDKRSGH